MKNPCARDCPRRTIGCHGKCPDYAAFAAWREEVRQASYRRNQIIGAEVDAAERKYPRRKR